MTKIEAARNSNQRRKIEAHKMLGGKCVVCDFYHPDCMIIDHIIPINGIRKYGAGNDMYSAIVRGRLDATEFSNLQLLCCNCSAIKTKADKRSGIQKTGNRYSKGANNA
jgi:5-methylcytosine-specific restriction endonuclease McrA